MLPILLMILMGLDYFFEITAMRQRAIEAARYFTWETAWYLRDNGKQFGAERPSVSNTMRSIPDVKIQRFFVDGQADAARRKLNEYSDDITAPSFASDEPRGQEVVETAIGFIAKAADGLSEITNGDADANSAVGDLFNELSGPLSAVGDFGFFLDDLWARNTNWPSEADHAIFTARVEYKANGINFFHLIKPTDIVQFSSVLSHPLLIVRTDDENEFEQLVGGSGVLDCSSNSSQGHIFDAWMVPTDFGPASGLGTGLTLFGTVLKCIPGVIGNAFSFMDSIAATELGFRMPEGTLKEFPEQH